jgi:hypothetical protein
MRRQVSAQEIVHLTAMSNTVQSQYLCVTIYPEEGSVVSHAILVQPLQIFGEVAKWGLERFWVLG